MIVTTAQLFQEAYGRYAVGAYNINNMEQALGLFPVSYTHLDVYKRQATARLSQPLASTNAWASSGSVSMACLSSTLMSSTRTSSCSCLLYTSRCV